MAKLEVITVINCHDMECTEEKLQKAKEFLPSGAWIHLDIADGAFTFGKSGIKPEDFKKIHKENPKLNFEIHLMVEHPEKVFEDWLASGAKRIIVHLETLKDHQGMPMANADKLKHILDKCKSHKAEAMLAVNQETPVAELVSNSGGFSMFQILAVHPGPSGQRFYKTALEKIRILRKAMPKAKIEVDGGIDLESAKLCKSAGADMVASGTYIFGSGDPKAAYESLKSL